MRSSIYPGLAALAAGVLALTAPAQGNQAQLIEQRDRKLASPWLKNAEWITDYDKAREVAKKTGKPIFAYFTRSFAY